MDPKSLENLLTRLEILQIKLTNKRIDYHGIVPHNKKDDLEVIQTCIDIIKNLIIEPNYIWQKKK